MASIRMKMAFHGASTTAPDVRNSVKCHAIPSGNRRTLLGGASASILSGLLVAFPTPAFARGFDRYIKKRELDPLDSYLPPIVAAREGIRSAKPALAADPAGGRELLRSGPFDGIRDNSA